MKTTRLVATLALPGLWVLGGAACGSTTDRGVLDTRAVEEEVVATLNDAGLAVTTADCPDSIPAGSTEPFECTATDADGRAVEVSVQQTDGAGTLDITTTTVYAPVIEAGIDRNVTGASGARCPDGVALTDGAATIDCTAVVDGRTVTLTVTISAGAVTDVQERVDADGGDPRCEGQYTGGANPSCDACAAQNCCDALSACVSGTPCARYSLCVTDCADAACQATCGDQEPEGKQAADAVQSCVAACADAC